MFGALSRAFLALFSFSLGVFGCPRWLAGGERLRVRSRAVDGETSVAPRSCDLLDEHEGWAAVVGCFFKSAGPAARWDGGKGGAR